MESGSIQEITERLKSWCIHHERGLARAEWDSAYARQLVVDRLKVSLDGSGIPLVEIELPPNEPAGKTVRTLLETLQSVSGSVASITGIEWAFPEHGTRLDTLVGLSFQRETLASLAVRQIWWVPSHLAERFVLGVPDLDSWFQLRLHLTEVLPRPVDTPEVPGPDRKTVSVTEARGMARRFWERLEPALARNLPPERIWELGQPAVDALLAAGLLPEAQEILLRMPDFREMLARQIRDLRSAKGPEDLGVISLSRGLARALIDRGEPNTARQLQEDVVRTATRILGQDHPTTLGLIADLAETLWMQGDLAGSHRLGEQVMALAVRALGEDHPATLTSMNNLASTLRAQGDLAGARRLQERVLEARERMLGPDHPDTLTAMNNLALTLWSQGDLGGAERLQDRALQMSKRVLGEQHPGTLGAMNNLAEMLRERGDLSGARRLHERVLEANRQVLGEDHPGTLRSMNNLALTLAAQGDRLDAVRLFRRVVETSRRVLGEEHPDTLTGMNNLADALKAEGDLDGAHQLAERVLEVRRRALRERVDRE
jgi:tetratricopeptide (TPR) repeat protein